jgi:hypothetical protein
VPATIAPPTLAPALTLPPVPTPGLVPTPNLCGAPVNPWGYNFCVGLTITSPPVGFCTYFACVPNFANGRGFVMQCQDGVYSLSGGIPGSCSGHGGNRRALLAP